MDRIREAQKIDKEIAAIKEKLSKGKAKGFMRMSTTPYGLKTVFTCPMTRRSES